MIVIAKIKDDIVFNLPGYITTFTLFDKDDSGDVWELKYYGTIKETRSHYFEIITRGSRDISEYAEYSDFIGVRTEYRIESFVEAELPNPDKFAHWLKKTRKRNKKILIKKLLELTNSDVDILNNQDGWKTVLRNLKITQLDIN